MKQIQTIVSILMGTVCVVNGWAQLNQDKPAIGYVFPAGARQGTTVQVLAGGQFLRGAKDVYVSGEGVSGTVVRFVREPRNLNGDQRKELQRRLKAVVDKRFSELSPKQRNTLGIKEPPSDSEKKNAKADAREPITGIRGNQAFQPYLTLPSLSNCP